MLRVKGVEEVNYYLHYGVWLQRRYLTFLVLVVNNVNDYLIAYALIVYVKMSAQFENLDVQVACGRAC